MTTTRGPLRRAALLSLLAAALAAGPLAADGQAGTFTVRTCHGSNDQPAPTSDGATGWQSSTIGTWAGYGPDPANGCAQTDSGVTATDNGMVAINDRSVARQANTGIGWVYTAAPGTSISAYKLWMHGGARALQDGSDGSVVVNTLPFSGYDKTIGFDGSGGTGGSFDWSGTPFVDIAGRSASAVQVWAICGGPPAAVCAGGEPGVTNAYVRIYKAQMTTTDSSSPSSSAAAGDAISHGTWHGSESLAFNATDTGSGIYRLLVQSGADLGSLTTRSTKVLDGNGGRCQDENPANSDPYEFSSPQPCSSSISSDVQFDSTALADGNQLVRLQVEDAAGNRTTVYGPVTKTVDNVAPTISNVAVSGPAAREGETVSCSASVQGESPTISFRWVRSNADGSGAVQVPGAVSASYVLTAQDVGAKLRCVVTAADAGGQASGTSALTDGPFANGAVVAAFCNGRPTGPRDECGDLDGDGTMNRLDGDIDGDGAINGVDPDPWDANVRPAVVSSAPGATGATGAQGTPGATGSSGTSVADTARVDQNVVPVTNPNGGSGTNGSPVDDEAVLAAYFERGTGKRRTVTATATAATNQRLRIRGSLKTHDGKPIVGAKVYLAQKKPSGTWKIDGGTISRQDGSLLLFTRKGGVSRQMRLVYFPRDGRDANRGSGTLSLRIRQGARLSLSRSRLHNRSTLRFGGKVDGAVTGRGPLVQVQVKLPAGWSTFASSRARHGRFHLSYRFMRTTRRTTYRFRVRVVPNDSAAYVSGTSRVRKVVVLP